MRVLAGECGIGSERVCVGGGLGAPTRVTKPDWHAECYAFGHTKNGPKANAVPRFLGAVSFVERSTVVRRGCPGAKLTEACEGPNGPTRESERVFLWPSFLAVPDLEKGGPSLEVSTATIEQRFADV